MKLPHIVGNRKKRRRFEALAKKLEKSNKGGTREVPKKP